MRLSYRIAIQRKQQVQAADGSLTTTRTEVCQTYAAIKPLRGKERDEGNQSEAQADYKFTIRRRGDLQADDVIVWGGREYNIRFIADWGERSLYMSLEAELGVAV